MKPNHHSSSIPKIPSFFAEKIIGSRRNYAFAPEQVFKKGFLPGSL
jgi:hypothetical protein